MKKEEILEMSRNAKQDEGMEHAENQGRKIGYFVFAVMFAIVAIFSLFTWQQSTLYAVSCLFWAFFAAEAFAKYRFSRKKAFLATVIAAGIASVCFLANFMLIVLR